MNAKQLQNTKILAVEDDPGDFGLIRVYLRQAGYGVDDDHAAIRWAKTLSEAKNLTTQTVPDIVLLDLNLPDSAGMDTVIAMRNVLPDVPIIVLSGNDNKDVAIAALNEGAQDYLVKGNYEHDALGRAILHALVRTKLESRLHLLEIALNSVSSSIVVTDANAHIQWVNPAFTQLTGYSVDEALGHKPNELINSGKQSQPFYQGMWKTILSGVSWHGEIINRRKSGELYHEDLTVSPVKDQNNQISNFVAVKQDISERKTIEEALRESEERFHLIFETSIDGALFTIPDGSIVAANPAACSMFQRTEEEIINIGRSGLVDISDPRLQLALEERERTGKFVGELTFVRKDGTKFPGEVSSAVFKDKEGNLRTSITIRDVTERKKFEEQILHMAHYDQLTDLPNRALFSDRLQQALSIAKRDKVRMALMFLDLDKFKPINDDLGHHVGDLLLVEAAKRMQHCVRESDTVARLGGDEFVVLLPIVETEQDSLLVAEKIRQALYEPFELDGKSLNISCSVGIVIYPEHGSDETQLIKNADLAMYYAKEAGRNKVMLFNPEM